MDIQEIKGFIAVARLGSFSKAAVKTYRSQPAVSMQIKSLEDELGVRLIDRSGKRKIFLTAEGSAFLKLITPIMDELSTLKMRFHEKIGGAMPGSLKVATHSSVMIYLMPKLVKTFKKKQPECDISIVNRGRTEIFTMLRENDADLGITSLTKTPEDLEFKPFARFKRVLIAPQDHPLSGKKKITPKDLSDFPLILSPEGGNTRSAVEAVLHKLDLPYSISVEITGREALKTYTAIGMGISVIEEFYLSEEDKKKFHCDDISDLFGFSEYGLLIRKNRYTSPQTRTFMDICCKTL